MRARAHRWRFGAHVADRELRGVCQFLHASGTTFHWPRASGRATLTQTFTRRIDSANNYSAHRRVNGSFARDGMTHKQNPRARTSKGAQSGLIVTTPCGVPMTAATALSFAAADC